MKSDSNQFIFDLAHEIRNPLTNINLCVQMINDGIKGMPIKSYMNIIERSSKRINAIIEEFLKYETKDEFFAERYSIHQLLDEVVEMAEDRMALKNISVLKKYATNDCSVLMNRREMKIAISNIVINAIDAMVKDEGILTVETNAFENSYMIKIEDNGCGIKKDDLSNIFKPYFTHKPGGLGIGLAQTQDILRSNKVHVHVDSEEGKGTSFMLFFEKLTNGSTHEKNDALRQANI